MLQESGASEAESTLRFFEEAADIQVAWTKTATKTSIQVKEERAAEEAAAQSEKGSCGDNTGKGVSPLDADLPTRGAHLLALDQAALDKEVEFVKTTIKEREKQRKRTLKAKAKEDNLDYSKTLSGTIEDTKTEKAFTELMKEMDGKADLPEDPFAEILRVITIKDWPEVRTVIKLNSFL